MAAAANQLAAAAAQRKKAKAWLAKWRKIGENGGSLYSAASLASEKLARSIARRRAAWLAEIGGVWLKIISCISAKASAAASAKTSSRHRRNRKYRLGGGGVIWRRRGGMKSAKAGGVGIGVGVMAAHLRNAKAAASAAWRLGSYWRRIISSKTARKPAAMAALAAAKIEARRENNGEAGSSWRRRLAAL